MSALPRWLAWVDRLAERPGRAIVLVGVLSFAAALGMCLLKGVPTPAVHDEFAYLLAGDTFASGRLTNPTHPFWQHFETYHVNHVPTYASKYPPAQGAFLAIGQRLTGQPIVGVWLSVSLMSAALVWMLFAWVPRRWAILAGVLATLQLSIVGYWAQSYWGGAAAGLGGILVYGALPRLLRAPRARDGLLLGLGFALLANSRPLEGLLISLPVAGVVVWRLARGPDRQRLLAALAPCAVLGIATLVWLGVYNTATTGSPTRMAYQVHEEMYASVPTFVWQPPLPLKEYRHAQLETYWREWALERHTLLQSPTTFVARAVGRAVRLLFFLGGTALLAAMLWPGARPNREITFAGLVTLSLLILGMFTKAAHAHYLAPALGLLWVVLADCMRRVHLDPRRWVGGPMAIQFIFFAAVASFAFRVVATPRFPRINYERDREQVIEQLSSTPGDDLVIVRYGPGSYHLAEWVYNRADIDGAGIVWARDMGEARNRSLREYFADRQAWLLEVNERARLQPIEDVLRR